MFDIIPFQYSNNLSPRTAKLVHLSDIWNTLKILMKKAYYNWGEHAKCWNFTYGGIYTEKSLKYVFKTAKTREMEFQI